MEETEVKKGIPVFSYLQYLRNLSFGMATPKKNPGLEAPLPDLVLRSLGHKCAAAERCRSDQQNAEMAGNELELYPKGFNTPDL